MSSRLLAHTPVRITRNGVPIATASVIEHTDDSEDNDIDVAEQLLRVHVIATFSPRIVPGRTLTLSRPLAEEGADGWAPTSPALRDIGRVSVGGGL